MFALLVLISLIGAPLWSMQLGDDTCQASAIKNGISFCDVQSAYKVLYKEEWMHMCTEHCQRPQQANSDLQALKTTITQEKNILELIRPRPAAQIIPCDNKLMAVALLLRIFPGCDDGESSSYEDEDD
jgi:hypothetical protein